MQDSRRRIWIDAAKLKIGSFFEINARLGQRCLALWEEVLHPEHVQFSVAEMLEHERTYLMPMPTAFDGSVEESARVSSTCLVSVARNRCSVPCELHGQMGSTRMYLAGMVIVADDKGDPRHGRLSNVGETRCRSIRAAAGSSIDGRIFSVEPLGWRTVADRCAWRGRTSVSSDCRCSG